MAITDTFFKRDDTFCPGCGHRGVWSEFDEEEPVNCTGPMYVCTQCKSVGFCWEADEPGQFEKHDIEALIEYETSLH